MHLTLTRFKKKLLLHLSITLAVVGVLIWVIAVSGSSIGDAGDSIKKLQTEFSRRLGVIQALANARTEYRKAAPAQKTLQNIIPQKEKFIDLSQDFRRIALRVGIGYTYSFIEEVATAPETPGFIRFRLSLTEGNFGKFSDFLKELKNFQYVMRIEEVLVNYDKMEVVGSVFFR